MTTIYFDQFAISGMSEPTNNLWYQIRNILFDLKSQNKICCCTSPETIFETSQRHCMGVIDNYAIISKLLDNCYLNDIRTIICQQIAKDIKDIESNPFLYVNHNFTSNEFNFSLKKVIQYEFDSKDIPSFPIEMSDKQITCFVKILYDNRKRMFFNSIESYITGNQSNDIYAEICRILVEQFDFTKFDFQTLLNNIQYGDFRCCPTLRIQNLLEPYIFVSEKEVKNNITFKNDLFDIRRISSAIPYCDILLCDSKWKNCLRKLNIDDEYNIKVFSAKSVDLKEFESYLSSL